MSLFHAYNQTVADGTATSVVRPSDWNSAHNQQITLAGNTAGQSTVSGTNIAFQGGNNVTLSAITAAGAATILVSGANTVAQSVQPVYYSASGSTSSANTLDFGNSNGVSFSLSNGSVVATVATNYMASNQSSNFVNTSQSSLFQQTSATSAITSAAFPSANTTNFAGTGFTSTTTAGTAVTAALGTNGLTMAVPAYLTTYVAQTTQTQAAGAIAGTGFTSTTTAGTAITAALGTNGLSMAVPNYLTTYVGQTTQTQAAGSIAGIGYTSTTQAGTTVGVTQGTAGLSVAWPPFITTAAGGTGGYPVAFSASGGSSSFSTLTFSNLVNNVTFSNSAGQVVMSHSLAGQGTTLNLTNLNGTLDVGSNGVALSLNNVDANYAAWELEGANTAGTTATTLTTSGVFYLSGGNNITLSGNSNTIVIQGNGGGTTASFMEPNMLVGTSLSSFGQNSLYFVPVKPAFDVSMTAVNMLVSLSNATSSNNNSVAQTIQYGWYSLGTGASTSQIGLMQSSSIAIIASYSSNLSGRYTISQGTNSTTYSSAGIGSTSAWTGQKIFAMPMATMLSEGGEYYFMMQQSTASSGNTGALRMSHIVLNNMTNASFGRLAPSGITASSSTIIPNYNGFIFSATSASPPTSFALTERRIQSNIRMYIQLDA